ncbi:transcription antiterminator LicT [Enterococcus ratti]|uniref:Transcription antiterminator LicT n=2 Tax=Enterococcus ratti TaxID=150033 RepID=A0A1L8WFN7_9ENTE|nr:transcription antiterminator LicT [Enterococcus ratti]
MWGMIKKILNNNAVLVNEDGKDFIWIGTGVGFQKKIGQKIDKSKVEKVFVLHKKNISERFSTLMESIPIEYASLADDIIALAKKMLRNELSEMLYVSLIDHLYHLVKLHKQGRTLHNRISWEIKKFYPKEFEVGKQALVLLEKKTGYFFEEEEAGNIALHLINAQLTDELNKPEDIQELTKKIRDIVALIRLSNKIEIDESTLAFERFITHLRFFFQRLSIHKESFHKRNLLLDQVKEQYPNAFKTMLLIEEYLKTLFTEDEQLYLTLHIHKIIEND